MPTLTTINVRGAVVVNSHPMTEFGEP